MLTNCKREIIITYKGQIDFDGISEFILELKEKMKLRKVRYSVYKKMLTMMIESMENIIHYGSHFAENTDIARNYPPEFQVYFANNAYTIETANPIRNTDIPNLSGKLAKIFDMDKKDIKTLYKEKITDGKFTAKGGAGLGIIEMAKISDNKLQFHFSKIDDLFSIFALKLSVNNSLQKEID